MNLRRSLATERAKGAVLTWYYIQGDEGTVQFLLMRVLDLTPIYDLGVHSPKPLHEGHEAQVECNLAHGPCFFLSSMREGKRIYDQFRVTQDPELIWGRLETMYENIFEA